MRDVNSQRTICSYMQQQTDGHRPALELYMVYYIGLQQLEPQFGLQWQVQIGTDARKCVAMEQKKEEEA